MMLSVYVLSLFFITTQASVSSVPSSSRQGYHCDTLLPELLRLERTVAVLTTKLKGIDSIKSEIKSEVKSQIKKTSDTIGEHDVAFEAALPSDLAGVQSNTVFKFANIQYNKGKGYSRSTGIFTAPVSGTYMFWAHIMVNDNNSLHVELVKGGHVIARGFTPAGTRYGVASISTVMFLLTGDQLWFMKKGSTSLRGENWSSFGGALLRSKGRN